MTYDVQCGCGAVHRMKANEQQLCRCGATVKLQKDHSGWVTPWANSPSNKAPTIINAPPGSIERQIYKRQPNGE